MPDPFRPRCDRGHYIPLAEYRARTSGLAPDDWDDECRCDRRRGADEPSEETA